MKWGVRRYQNKDGSLTEKGRKRYAEGIAKKAIEESDPDAIYSKLYDNKSLHKEIAGDIKTNLGKSYAKEIQAVKDSKSELDKYEKAVMKVEEEFDSNESWKLIADYAWDDAIKSRPKEAEFMQSLAGDKKLNWEVAEEIYDKFQHNLPAYDEHSSKMICDFLNYADDDAFINGMNRRQDELCAKYGADYESWNKAKDAHSKNCEKLTNAIIGDKFANKTMEELANTPLWERNEAFGVSSLRDSFTLKSTLEKSYKYL